MPDRVYRAAVGSLVTRSWSADCTFDIFHECAIAFMQPSQENRSAITIPIFPIRSG
jgi:hypothetical protein